MITRGQRSRAARFAVIGTVVALVTSGCGVLGGGLRGVTLPGGADLGDNPYDVTIEFADVVDLVPQSIVKVADVDVGTVKSVKLDPRSWHAMVTVAVNGGVKLPANSEARVRTTSLLGEKFVELMAPAQGAQGTLTNGAVIPLAQSGRAVEVEEIFGSLSLLLNGGGVAQIKTIATELNKALKGNEPEIRSLLENLDKLVSALDARKGDITTALDGLNRLSATLVEGKPKIENALDNLGPGIKELSAQREQLVDMLKSLDRLSGVATNVVNRSRDDVLADLKQLTPTLQKLAESGQALPNSLEVLGSPPFTDAAVDAFAGDFSNLYATVNLDLKDLVGNLISGGLPPLPGSLSSLFPQLPGPAQLLSPLVGSTTEQPAFPLLGALPNPLTPSTAQPAPGATPAPTAGSTPPSSSAPTTTTTAPAPTTAPSSDGGGLGGLFGGGA